MSKTQGKYKMMTEGEFNKIKAMRAAGITTAQIEDWTGRHRSTTDIVDSVNTWKQFKEYRAKQYRDRIAKEARRDIEDKKEVLNEIDKSQAKAERNAELIVESYINVLREINERLNDIETALVNLDNKIPNKKRIGVF